MERYLVRQLPRCWGLALAALGLTALLGFNDRDPTLLNLLYPAHGIANPLGYPGALIAGTLLDLFGGAALLLPLLLALWGATPRDRPLAGHFALHALVLVASVATLTAQWGVPAGLGLASSGVVGLAGRTWIAASVGPWVGQALLLLAAGYALWRLLYLRALRLALRDARTFALFAWARVLDAAGAALQVARGAQRAVLARMRAVALALGERLRAGVRDVRFQVRGAVLRLGSAVTRPNYGIRDVRADRWQHPPPPRSSGALASGRPGHEDDFDAWFAPLEERPLRRETSAAESAQPAPTLPPRAARQAAEWRERINRYTQNLDLDWERRQEWERWDSDDDETFKDGKGRG